MFFLIKSRWVVQLKMKSGEIKNQLKNYTNQLLNFEKKIKKKKLKNQKYAHLL